MTMTPETAQVIAACVTTIGVVLTAWLANGARTAAQGAKHQATGAHAKAEQAVTYSKPTGNGFAADVRRQLAEIATIATDGRDAALRAEDKADRAGDAIHRHLEAHANSGLHIVAGTAVQR